MFARALGSLIGGRGLRAAHQPVRRQRGQEIAIFGLRQIACGELLFLEPVADVLERYDVDTLEEAFFAATGRTFEDEKTEDDEEREVFA